MHSQFKNSSLGFYLYAFLIVIIVAAVAFVFWFMITGYKLGTYEENTLLGSVYVGGLKEEEVEPIMFTRIDRWLGDETILFEAKYQGYSYAFNRELFDFNITQSTQNIVNGKTNQLEVYFGGSKKQDIIRELKSLVFIQGIKENIDYDSLVDDVLRDASLMKSYSSLILSFCSPPPDIASIISCKFFLSSKFLVTLLIKLFNLTAVFPIQNILLVSP